jgi:hypothetical protein
MVNEDYVTPLNYIPWSLLSQYFYIFQHSCQNIILKICFSCNCPFESDISLFGVEALEVLKFFLPIPCHF